MFEEQLQAESLQSPAAMAPEAEKIPTAQPIGPEQVHKFTQILQKYKAGKAVTEHRIVESENWWKLRNDVEEERHGTEARAGWRSKSSWLHSVIVAKHADAMDSYPTPTILPREQNDEQEAKSLTSIIPCVLEMTHFDSTYSDVQWQKIKTGTGVYRITWDKHKLNGLGDISIERANLLNLFWEPGVTDIQKSRYFFDTELVDEDLLKEQYPQIEEGHTGSTFTATKFLYDDSVPTDGKVTVIGCYYHKNGALHYCKYVGDTVLESTENAGMAEGLYNHGLYPFVFDTLYPNEGSPCGYGYVEVCRNPQTEIDLLRTAIVHNAMAGATPRHFIRADGSINEEEYLDLTKPVVHVNGNLGEDSIRVIPHTGLDGNYVSVLNETVNELRETSGHTEVAAGTGTSGATAASAIAALQEASGKTSRDSTRTAYRAYNRLVELCIELIRQFYDIPRQFRITGQTGQPEFVQYDNSGIKPQPQGTDYGIDMGYRLPAFDIKVDAEKKSAYSQLSQNELALQFYQAGMYNPQMADQALSCVDMMEFTGKDKMVQRLQQQQTLQRMNQQLIQYAATLAAKYQDLGAMQQLAAINQNVAAGQPIASGAPTEIYNGLGESKITESARQRTAATTEAD